MEKPKKINEQNMFVKVLYDLKDFKTYSIWAICIILENKILYVEFQKNNLSDKLPKERFDELYKSSYFNILATGEATLKVENKPFSTILAYKDTDENVKQKVIDFINENIKRANDYDFRTIEFLNTFEAAIFNDFIDYMFDNDKSNYNVHQMLRINEPIFNMYIEYLKENNTDLTDDDKMMFERLMPVVECMSMYEFIQKVFNNKD